MALNIAEHRLRHKPANRLAARQPFPDLTRRDSAGMACHEPAPQPESFRHFWGTSGPCHDGKYAQPGQPPDVTPVRQFLQRISADDEIELGIGMTALQFRDGFDGVRRAAAPNFDVVGHELFTATDGQPHHFQAFCSGNVPVERLVRRRGGGDEFHAVQPQGLHRIVRDEQVPDVDRVERAAEQANPCVAFHRWVIILASIVNASTNPVSLGKRFRYALETAGFRLLICLLPCLSFRGLQGLARGLGSLAYRVAGKPRRIALANLDVAFGHTKPLAEKERIARCSMQNLATTILTLFWSARQTPKELHAVVEPDAENLDFARQVVARGKGVVCATLHYGNWELLSLATGNYGFPVHIVAEFSRNAALAELIHGLRSRTGNRIIAQRGAAPKLLRALRKGEVVVLIIDQNAPEEGGGEWLEFFGLPAFNNVIAAALAIRTGAALCSCHTVPMPDGRVRVVYGPEIPYTVTDDYEADVRRVSQQCLDHFEQLIRQQPGFWLWTYKRWKHRRDLGDTRYPFYTSEGVLPLPSRANKQTNAPQSSSAATSNASNVRTNRVVSENTLRTSQPPTPH